jgi:flagellar basal-body rod protein FlgC
MNLFGVLDISNSALLAQRQRAEVAASNMANAETTRTPEGGPYRRRSVIFSSHPMEGFNAVLGAMRSGGAQGVAIESVLEDASPPLRRYDPGHPDADSQGYVFYPAVDPYQEMVDLMGASRSYQLNAAAVKATKFMIEQSLELLK